MLQPQREWLAQGTSYTLKLQESNSSWVLGTMSDGSGTFSDLIRSANSPEHMTPTAKHGYRIKGKDRPQ